MVKLARAFDKYIGNVLVFFLSFFKFLDKEPKHKKKFLIIKLWAVGDSVLTLALIKAIKTKFKSAAIDVVTTRRADAVYQAYPLVDNIYSPYEIIGKIRHYDVVFDCEPYFNASAILAFFSGKIRIGFRNQFRSRLYSGTVLFNKKQHMVQNYLDMIRVLGIKYDTKNLEKLSVKEASKQKIDSYLKDNKISSSDLLIGITPGIAESVKSRMWFEDRFAELSDNIIRKLNAKIIFIDSSSNLPIVNRIIGMMEEKPFNAAGKFSLAETFYLISKCKVFISNDTGPMHIAAAQGCKTIGLFGPNTPVLWGPYGRQNISVYKTRIKPSIENDKGIFPDYGREEFMGPIKVSDVYSAVLKLLKKKES